MQINSINTIRYDKNSPSIKISSNAKPIQASNNILNKQLENLARANLSLAFKGSEDDKYSYYNFKKAAKEAGIKNVKDCCNQMIPENLIGSGGNSEVYKFSDPRLDNWLMKVHRNTYRTYNPLDDINMGQSIALFNVEILKKINGTPHSIENWSHRASTEVFTATNKEATKFLSDIEKIADFPQDSFDDYAKKLKILSDKDYKMDSMNPNNLLIDYDKKEINIIDFGMPGHHPENTIYDLIMPLLDFSMYKGYLEALSPEDRYKLKKLSKIIVDKCKLSATKYDISTNKSSYLSYLEYLDRAFETDTHIKRFKYMEDMFQQIEYMFRQKKPRNTNHHEKIEPKIDKEIINAVNELNVPLIISTHCPNVQMSNELKDNINNIIYKWLNREDAYLDLDSIFEQNNIDNESKSKIIADLCKKIKNMGFNVG